jgi:hypothetical protein
VDDAVESELGQRKPHPTPAIGYLSGMGRAAIDG